MDFQKVVKEAGNAGLTGILTENVAGAIWYTFQNDKGEKVEVYVETIKYGFRAGKMFVQTYVYSGNDCHERYNPQIRFNPETRNYQMVSEWTMEDTTENTIKILKEVERLARA